MLKITILFIGLIIILIFLIINFTNSLYTNSYSNIDINQFYNKIDDPTKILIKKTNKYKQVYENDENRISIWEPLPIDDFFPIGQIIQNGTNYKDYPNELSILLKHNLETVSNKYTLLSPIDDNIAIWKLESPIKTTKFLSNIICKGDPHKNGSVFQGIHTEYVLETNIEDYIGTVREKNEMFTSEISFWKIRHSSYFKINSNEPHYFIPNYNTKIEEKLKIKKTNNYRKVWSKTVNKELLTIWKPSVSENYTNINDILLIGNIDPNDKGIFNTNTIHKNNCKPPYAIKTKFETLDLIFWEPMSYNGYTNIGDIITLKDDKPNIKDICTVPIESVLYNKNSINVSILDETPPIYIWTNNNFIYSTNSKIPTNVYTLNSKFIEYDRDNTDESFDGTIIFYPKNIDTINTNILLNIIEQRIASKLDIDVNRVVIKELDKKNNKIHIQFKPRIYKSETKTIDVINEFSKILYSNPLNITYINNIILILKAYNITKKNDYINLDTSLFNNKINQP